jgi:hypothetical protein
MLMMTSVSNGQPADQGGGAARHEVIEKILPALAKGGSGARRNLGMLKSSPGKEICLNYRTVPPACQRANHPPSVFNPFVIGCGGVTTVPLAVQTVKHLL